jgi:hypothetical protein
MTVQRVLNQVEQNKKKTRVFTEFLKKIKIPTYPIGNNTDLFCWVTTSLHDIITHANIGVISLSSTFCPLYCPSFFDLRFQITPLLSSTFWPLHCPSFFEFGNFVINLIYGFRLPLWYTSLRPIGELMCSITIE